MKRTSRNLLALLLLLFGCGGGVTAGSAEAEKTIPRDWRGAWQARVPPEKAVYLNIEPDRIVEHDGTALIVRGFIRRSGDRLTLRKLGLQEEWTVVKTADAALRVVYADGTVQSFRRLSRTPPQVRLEPLRLPSPRPLPPERIRAIQDEIAARTRKEQEILHDPVRRNGFALLQQENLAFLRQLLSEVGWIDRNRFGVETSVQAALMAKHTEDLQLLMTILPHAEEDFRKAGRGRAYAILFDAVQLELGRKQRYGTQVQEDAAGQPFVLPLDEPDKVNTYLKRIGLPPLEVYREKIGNAVFAGKVVQVRQEEVQ